MTEFTPGSALIGGLLIGFSAALMSLASDRVAGISGIVGGLLRPSAGDRGWRLAFLIGLPIGAGLVWATGFGHAPAVGAPDAALIAGGILVGFGTRLGNGCTSGHGICGVSRLSQRSLVATATFMTAGIGTVYVVRHVLGGAW